MKSWKKIEETRKRTNDINKQKKRNEEKIQKKIFDLQLEQEQKRQMSHSNYMLAQQRAQEKKQIQKTLEMQKKEEAKQVKMVKQQNDQRRNQNNYRQEQEARMKNQIGLQSKRLAQMKVKEEQERKRMMARKDVDNKCHEEEALRNLKMDEIAQMEKLEMELIKRLQNTQAIEKEAYMDLEKALSQPSAILNTQALRQNLNQK